MTDLRHVARKNFCTRISPAMFFLSLSFLALVAALIVLWLHVEPTIEGLEERVLEFSDSTAAIPMSPAELQFQAKAAQWGRVVALVLLGIWPIFVIEQAVYAILANGWRQFYTDHPFAWLICLVPPLRLCARNHEVDGAIWFPHIGWQLPTPPFYRQLERKTSIPMVGIALLILPVLGLQMKFGDDIVNHPGLRIALQIGTGVIWFAFAAEFIVMVSVTDKKLNYCKKHWLDLVIILLPLVSFLRSLRLLRATKLIKLGKLQQLSRLVRAYRLRGVTMRALRALMLLEVLHRILRVKPEKRLAKLELAYQEKQHELDLLKEEIAQLRSRLELASSASELQSPALSSPDAVPDLSRPQNLRR